MGFIQPSHVTTRGTSSLIVSPCLFRCQKHRAEQREPQDMASEEGLVEDSWEWGGVTKHVRYIKWRNPHLYMLYGYGLCKWKPTPKNSLTRYSTSTLGTVPAILGEGVALEKNNCDLLKVIFCGFYHGIYHHEKQPFGRRCFMFSKHQTNKSKTNISLLVVEQPHPSEKKTSYPRQIGSFPQVL